MYRDVNIIIYQMHRRTSRGVWFHQKLRGCLTEVPYLIFYGFPHNWISYRIQIHATLVS